MNYRLKYGVNTQVFPGKEPYSAINPICSSV